jgi:Lrp/AsnC family transcriptional regulator for asnA, asnC and gidA
MIDEVDQKLILELQRDGRMSFCELGKLLGVTEGTVRHRFKRLTKSGIMKVVAVPNMSKLGYGFISIVAIQVSMAELNKVCEALYQNVVMCQLTWVTGRYDLIAVIITRSTEEFADIMAKEISMIPGVTRTETFVSLRVLKGAASLLDTSELVRYLDVSSENKNRNR